ncbi:MAG TPA: hypothetical protein DD381_01515 [Lentisphaeria bacterium]|nr:MAG: hypothetical protein A2X47_10515 [Lentisphaerae bacterium GWF2_38_69]HBM15021.1 hypothetical protein [Lentisphaeria bacterium]
MNKKIVSYLMFAMITLAVSTTDIYVPAMPEMTRYFDTTVALVGLTITTMLIGMAFGTLVWGVFSDTYGRRPVLIISLIIYSLISLLIACSPNIYCVIILRFFQGVITSVFAIVCRLVLNDFLEGQELFRAMNLLNLGLVLSPAIAPVIGAQLSTWFDWRANFTFSCVGGVIMLLLLLKYVKETNKNKKEKLPPLLIWFGDYFKVIRHTHYSINNIMIMANYAIYFAFITISSFIYVTDLNFSPTLFALMLLFASGSYFLGSYYAKFIKSRYENRKYIDIMLVADLITLAGAFLLLINCFSHYYWVQVILISLALGLTRFGFGLMFTPGQMRALEFFPDKSGFALGACFFLMFLSGSFGAAWVSCFHRNHMLGLAVVVTTLTLMLIFLHYLDRRWLKMLRKIALIKK